MRATRRNLELVCLVTSFFLVACSCLPLHAQFIFSGDYRQADRLEGFDLKVDFDIVELPLDNNDIIYNLYEDSQGYVWLRLGTSGCLRFDGYKFEQFTNQVDDQPWNLGLVIHDIEEDTMGSHWISSVEGMIYYDSRLRKSKLCAEEYLRNTTDKWGRSFFDIEKTEDGHLLVATKAGLLVYNIEEDKIKARLHPQTLIEDRESTNNHFRHIKADPLDPNLFWCVLRSGLFLYDHKNSSFQKFQTPNWPNGTWPYFAFRYEEMVGQTLYSVVRTNFLLGFDTQHRTWSEVGRWQDTSQHETVVYDIKAFRDRYLFMSARTAGPFLIDPVQKLYYPLQFMVEGKEPAIKEFWGFLVDQQGYLWTSLRPNKILRSKKPVTAASSNTVALAIQRIYVNNKELDYGRIEDHHLSLDKHERSVSLQYAFINPPRDSNAMLYYRLARHQQEWQVDSLGRIYINRLKPGQHVFEARLSLNHEEIKRKGLHISVAYFWYERWWVQTSGLLASILFVYGFNRYNVGRIRKKEQEKSRHEKALLELEARALKSQMNPHFIFNSLNAIKGLIQDRNGDRAIHYLTLFSKFVRKVLHYSEERQITMDEEIEMCRYYLEMEELRFEKSFHFTIEIDQAADLSFVSVPPLILQPFLENAIWHGLLHKRGNRLLQIKVEMNDVQMKCVIEDNGIGRVKARQLRSGHSASHKSFGTKLIEDRLQVNQSMYKHGFEVEIIDKMSAGKSTGTRVELKIEL